MDRTKLKTAVEEAKRFLQRANAFPDGDRYDYHPKEQGAIKRASMDLTRALAELRK